MAFFFVVDLAKTSLVTLVPFDAWEFSNLVGHFIEMVMDRCTWHIGQHEPNYQWVSYMY